MSVLRRVRPVVLIACCLLVASPLAAGAEYSRKVRAACTGDAKRLCPKQKLGSSEMRYCMESRSRSISSGCVRALEDEGIVPRGALRR